MNIKGLMKKELPQIPDKIKTALRSGNITPTQFNQMNDILKNENRQNEDSVKN